MQERPSATGAIEKLQSVFSSGPFSTRALPATAAHLACNVMLAHAAMDGLSASSMVAANNVFSGAQAGAHKRALADLVKARPC